jgi:nucleoside-diphosphate-sugar epimerase
MLLNIKYSNNEIFNVCSNNPIRIKDLIKFLSNSLNFNKIKNAKSIKFEVYKTHGSNKKLMKITNFKNFSNLYEKIDNIILWHKKYKNLI